MFDSLCFNRGISGEGQLAKAKIKRLYLIPILSKALDVIELLEQDNAPLTLEDVYQRTKISKTSVYRILKTLVHRGYLAQTPSGQYRLVSRPRRLRFGSCGRDLVLSMWESAWCALLWEAMRSFARPSKTSSNAG